MALNNAPQPNARQLLASLIMGSIAILPSGIQPIVLGTLADAHKISLDEFGLLAMAEIFALGLGVVWGNAWLYAQAFRRLIVGVGLVVVLADVLSIYGRDAMDLLALRAVAGVAEGILVWASTSMILRSAAPTRLAGIYMAMQALLQAALGAVLASYVLPHWGWQGGFLVLGGLSCAFGLLAWTQPARLMPLHASQVMAQARSKRSRSWPRLLPLAVAFCQLTTVGAVWAFLDPLGQQIGFDSSAVKNVISAALLMQVAGAGLATALIRRWSSVATLCGTSLALCAIAWGLHDTAPGELSRFMVLSLLLGLVWLFAMPFQIALALRMDPVGETAAMIPAAQLLGVALGPLIASFTIQGENLQPAMTTAALFALLATALLAWAHLHPRRVKPDSAVGRA